MRAIESVTRLACLLASSRKLQVTARPHTIQNCKSKTLNSLQVVKLIEIGILKFQSEYLSFLLLSFDSNET